MLPSLSHRTAAARGLMVGLAAGLAAILAAVLGFGAVARIPGHGPLPDHAGRTDGIRSRCQP